MSPSFPCHCLGVLSFLTYFLLDVDLLNFMFVDGSTAPASNAAASSESGSVVELSISLGWIGIVIGLIAWTANCVYLLRWMRVKLPVDVVTVLSLSLLPVHAASAVAGAEALKRSDTFARPLDYVGSGVLNPTMMLGGKGAAGAGTATAPSTQAAKPTQYRASAVPVSMWISDLVHGIIAIVAATSISTSSSDWSVVLMYSVLAVSIANALVAVAWGLPKAGFLPGVLPFLRLQYEDSYYANKNASNELGAKHQFVEVVSPTSSSIPFRGGMLATSAAPVHSQGPTDLHVDNAAVQQPTGSPQGLSNSATGSAAPAYRSTHLPPPPPSSAVRAVTAASGLSSTTPLPADTSRGYARLADPWRAARMQRAALSSSAAAAGPAAAGGASSLAEDDALQEPQVAAGAHTGFGAHGHDRRHALGLPTQSRLQAAPAASSTPSPPSVTSDFDLDPTS